MRRSDSVPANAIKESRGDVATFSGVSSSMPGLMLKARLRDRPLRFGKSYFIL
jgi:hypothetical protein